jgi:pSer/pThr/pTyr-binding forkhead associated (FHA) protein
MESLNGTYVNRQPVESAMLVNGDEIRSASSAYVILSSKSEGGQTIPLPESGAAHRS